MTDWRRVLQSLAPAGRPEIIAMIADHADEQFAKWQINTVNRQATVIAHSFVETQGFTKLRENLNYSAQRLCEVWPKRFPTIASAAPYAHNPKALANKVYGGRMGNRPGTDDGWIHCGSGLWECTGRDNQSVIAKELQVTPETVAAWLIHPDHALECACVLFHTLGVAKYADAADVVGQTLKINGGKNALAERTAAFNKTRRLISAQRMMVSAVAIEADGADDDQAQVTASDLRAEGSRTIAAADQVQKNLVGLGTGVAAVGGAASQVGSAIDSVNGAFSSAKTATGAVPWLSGHWLEIALALSVCLTLYFAWRVWNGATKAKQARVDDARSGVNIGR